MTRFTENIDHQIKFNKGKNIFADPGILRFANETLQAISQIHTLNQEAKQSLIDYATDKAIEEFCRINQYYTFNSTARNKLREIYATLIDNLERKTASAEVISAQHYEKIKIWLQENNAFAEKIYKNHNPVVEPVPCSEYAAELQIKILRLDLLNLLEPVLDIGCGNNAHLVNFLRDKGIEGYGIDRFKFSSPNLITTDWLEYDYGKEKWGTIVSNLGFSNHFIHHNLRDDGNYLAYAKTYMAILNSLKPGGCFHYAPDLPFIEQYLENKKINISKSGLVGYNFKSVIVKKN